MNKRPETVVYSIIAIVSVLITAAAIITVFTVLATRSLNVTPTAVARNISVVPTVQPRTTSLARTGTAVPLTVPAATGSPTGPTQTPANTEPPIDATNRSATIQAIIAPPVTVVTEQVALAPTQQALTGSPAMTVSPTPSLSSSPSPIAALPVLTDAVALVESPDSGTTGTLDPTHQYATIRAIIGPRLTLTADRANVQTATAQVFSTVTYAAYQTQTALFETQTATPTGTDPGYTSTAINSTQIVNTAVAAAHQLLTQTYALEVTKAFQLTVNSIINQTLGVSSTPTGTDTSTPTPMPSPTSSAPTATLNPTETFATLLAAFNHSLTQTPEAQLAGSVTAVFQSTLQSFANQQAAATAAGVEAAQAKGLDPITASSAQRLAIILTIKNHYASTNGIAFSPNGTQFATANSDDSVRLWDTVTGAEIYSFPGLTDRVSVSISGDGNYLAAASSDSTVRLWDLRTQQELAPLRGHIKGVTDAVFSPTSLLLASISSDGTTRLWDIKNPSAADSLKQASQAVVFSPDGLRMLTGGKDSKINTWESLTGIELSSVRDAQPVSALAFSNDGRVFASADVTSVSIWDSATETKLETMTGPTKPITSVAFCADVSCVIASSRDGSIWIWNTANGARILTLSGSESGINSIAVSPDGRRLILGSGDNTVTVWAVPSS